MKKVSAEIPNVKLTFVGDGVELEALETQAASLSNITFLGEKSNIEVKELLDSPWIMCAPSIVRKRGMRKG